jgi:transposase-like protein
MGHKRKKFTKEFKEEALSHWENSIKSAEEVAVSLGIPNSNYLSRWKRELAKKGVDAFQAMVNFLARMLKLQRFVNN